MRYKNTAWFKRFVSGLLAVIMCVSLLPTSVFALEMDDDSGGGGDGGGPTSIQPPQNIIMSDYVTLCGGGQYHAQHNYEPGAGGAYIHEMYFTGNNLEQVGFCITHGAPIHKGKTWNLVGEYAQQGGKNEFIAMLLDYYYYYVEESARIKQELGNRDPTAAEREALLNGTSPYQPSYGGGQYGFWYCGVVDRGAMNASVQACVWAYIAAVKAGRGSELDVLMSATVTYPTSSNTPEVANALRILGAERRAAYIKSGYVGGDVEAYADEICSLVIGSRAGDYGKRVYYEYTPDGAHSSDQHIILPFTDVSGDEYYPVWLKLYKKIDAETGNPVSGAVFSVYRDTARSQWIADFTTTADGSAYVYIESVAKVGERTTLYVGGKTAPAGYALMSGLYQVEVDDTHQTQDTAIVVPGEGIVTEESRDDDDDTIIRKVDAKTNQGVGPCTFHFEGTTQNGEYKSFDLETDSSGRLNIQWATPGEPLYVDPGEYTVTEKIPPDGYDNTDEARHLVLEYDPITRVQKSSGQLIFKNNKLRTLRLIKAGPDDTFLAGAVFELYKDGVLYDTYTTDTNGEINVTGRDGKGLEEGYYEFVEIKAPEGYFIPKRHTVGVWLRPEEQTQSDPVTIYMVNYPETEIVIRKVSAGKEQPLAGAVFELMIDGELFGRVGPTGADGTIVIDPITYGQFLQDKGLAGQDHWTISVREVVAPDGYLMDDAEWQTAELWQGEKLKEFVFTDTPYPEILIYKRDAETQELLDGCSVKVTINGIDIGGPFVTGANGNEPGTVKIDYETYGRFLQDINGVSVLEKGWQVQVTEFEMPNLYNKDKQEGSIDGQSYTLFGNLGPQQSKIEFTFKDTHYRDLKVVKLDAETGWPLAGATFSLHCVKADEPLTAGNISDRQLTTDASGYVIFEDIPNGVYEITEIKAPNGYEEDPVWSTGDTGNKTTVIITSDSDPIVEVTAKNEPKSGFQLLKVDATTGQPIPGVTFEFTPMAPLTGSPFTATTDENGLITIESLNGGRGGVDEGTYLVVEKSAPPPYRVDSTPHTVEVRNGHDATQIRLTNVADGMLNIVKIDSVTGEPLPGAYFKISSANGNWIADVGPTGRNGYVSFGPLEPGQSYKVEEIRSPDGHILDPMPQTFTAPEDMSGQVITLFFGNAPLSNLWLRKVDAETGLGLQGAVFEITTGDGTIVRQNAETDESGYILLF